VMLFYPIQGKTHFVLIERAAPLNSTKRLLPRKSTITWKQDRVASCSKKVQKYPPMKSVVKARKRTLTTLSLSR
jgi:hypothetical protein